MLRFFHRRQAKADRADLSARLSDLERRAAPLEQHMQARIYNQAGDLCADASDLGTAKVYFGRAIDAYLEAGYFEAAAALCRKLIRLAPDVIRARATLAVLYLGKKLVEDSGYEVQLVDDYIRVARSVGDDRLLIYRLRVMANATENQELRVLLGQRLLELGDEEVGRKILHAVYREINGLAAAPQLDRGEQWDRLLRAAMMTPQDLVESEVPASVG